MWEHLVLEDLLAHFPDDPIRYWRDKQGREVDFVLTRKRGEVDAIECKWNPRAFDGVALQVFRKLHPKGRNYLLTPSADKAYQKQLGDLNVTVCAPAAQMWNSK